MKWIFLLAFLCLFVGSQAQMKYKFYARNLEDSSPGGGPPDASIKAYWWTIDNPQVDEGETSIVRNSYNPDFPEEMTLEHYEEHWGEPLWVVVMDYKSGEADQMMVSFVHPYNCLETGENCIGDNFYGSGSVYFVPIRNGTELYEVP